MASWDVNILVWGDKAVVSLVIFDLLGRKVADLIDGPLDQGGHQIEWDGRNGQGDRVATGVYFYRLQATGKRFLTRKMVLLK